MAAVPAHTNSVAHLEQVDTFTQPVDDPGDFVAGYAGELKPWELPELHERVTVTDAARLDFDADL
jgi:hypothetical protein